MAPPIAPGEIHDGKAVPRQRILRSGWWITREFDLMETCIAIPASGTNQAPSPPAIIQTPSPPAKLVTFHRLIPSARLPQRADRSAAGILPTRAYRYCEPATTASGFGYYIFPALDFSVRFDGYDVLWTYPGAGDWLPIPKAGSAQFPGFADYFASLAPSECAEYAPPLLGVLEIPGFMQIWSGLIARTAPGWSLLVRSPVNFGRPGGYEPFEGIVESDRWFGPLFTNIRLIKTDTPIEFRQEHPMLQVQPIPRIAYQEATLNNYELVPELRQFGPEDWDDYYDTVVRPNAMIDRPRGLYATASRKRRAAEAGPPDQPKKT
jgi:hypothetical protein